MTLKHAAGSFFALGIALSAGHFLAACTGDESLAIVTDDAGGGTGTDSAKSNNENGTSCGTGSECSSGNCVDGVCCASACSGTCEACNLQGSLGKCEPIPAGVDPAKECATKTPERDAGAEGDATATDGSVINEPDGGIVAEDTPCARTCNGQRACAFPGTEKTCGTAFCNTETDQARPSCNGGGLCELGVEACKAYACTGGAGCATSCTTPNDCLPSHFCKGATKTCESRVGNGTTCASDVECGSGFCVSGVCCNDRCDPAVVTGGTCTAATKVGECSCSACATGPCAVFYRDFDKDGFGDKTMKLVGCASDATLSSGGFTYVKNDKDCNDTSAKYKPGQTLYFGSADAIGGDYDFNCDGIQTKEIGEFVGGSCKAWTSRSLSCSSSATCGVTGAPTGHTGAFVRDGLTYSCKPTNETAFHSTVACGAVGTTYTCNDCGVRTSAVPAPTTKAGVAQRCR